MSESLRGWIDRGKQILSLFTHQELLDELMTRGIVEVDVELDLDDQPYYIYKVLSPVEPEHDPRNNNG